MTAPPVQRLPSTRAVKPWLISKRSEEHTSELQSRLHLVCRLLLEKKKHHIFSGAFCAASGSCLHPMPSSTTTLRPVYCVSHLSYSPHQTRMQKIALVDTQRLRPLS